MSSQKLEKETGKPRRVQKGCSWLARDLAGIYMLSHNLSRCFTFKALFKLSKYLVSLDYLSTYLEFQEVGSQTGLQFRSSHPMTTR